MDILSHGLWGATILRERKVVWWAFLAGIAPDVLGSGSAFVYLLTIGKFWGTGMWRLLPGWTKELYHFHHSLLGVLVYFMALSLFLRNYRLLILPYALHVLMDAFTHSNDSLDRLFYPLEAGANIHGLNWWEHWWIMALNGASLIIINAVLILRRRSRS